MNIFLRCERHQYDRQSHPHLQNVSIGDITLVKDVILPRLCWKKENDGLVRNDSLVRGVFLLYQLQTKRSILIVHYNILYLSNLKILNNRIKTSKFLTMITANSPSEGMNQDLDVLQQ